MEVEHLPILACGTSYNSGMVSRYWFESLAGSPCDVEIASEFRYRKSAVRRNSLMITLSQSGETADTLAGLRLSKSWVTLVRWQSVTFRVLLWCANPIWR